MFMTINENNRNGRKNSEKLRGCTYKITYISAAFYTLQLNLVQNYMLRMAPLVNSPMCKLSYLHIHKYQ